MFQRQIRSEDRHVSSSSSLSLVNCLFLCVQALQALQRQPNAAQYFQQLMLQQQINNAQLQNLAAVQQVKVCVCLSYFKYFKHFSDFIVIILVYGSKNR